MRLVDTSAWIEWLTGTPLGASLAAEMPDPAQWLVPTMVQLELAKWLTREVGEDKADRVIAFTQTCVVSALDTAIALSAAELCDRPGAWRRPADLRPAFRAPAERPVRAGGERARALICSPRRWGLQSLS